MINNKISTPFKISTLPPPKGRTEIIESIKKISKLKYGKQKAIVEQEIMKRSFIEQTATVPAPPIK
jgi:hypothetical protein